MKISNEKPQNKSAESQLDFYKNLVEEKDKTIKSKDKKIEELKERIKYLLALKYATSSEKYATKDQNAFDETPSTEEEPQDNPTKPDEPSSKDKKTIVVAAHTRKVNRGKRDPLPTYLPRVRVEHTIPEEELIGPDGERYEKIGEAISEQLEIIPQQIRVIENVCFKYAVKGKEELGVKTASMPKQPIPKSIATAGLLAHIAQAKYCHHLPLYRQEQIWSELDVRLPRNTLSRWMMNVGEQSQELIELMMEEIKLHGYIHADETPVTVLEKKGSHSSLNKHKGYMWVYTNNKGVVYDYAISRGSEHPAKMLENFTGYLQTDAYAGYDQFESKKIKLVGCFAHARRYFTNVKKAAGKKKNTPRVDYILKQIGKLYKLEKQAKDSKMNEIEIYNLRQQEAIPILQKLHKYLNDIKPRVPPESLLGKAISYSLNHWSKLTRYTDSGILNIDNNPAERKIKPFVIGRKNWLFCGNIKGAKASANLYSLIESAKLFNIKIFDYLKYVFENIPLADTPRKLEQLLPQYAQAHLPKNIIKPKQSVDE